MADYRKTGDGSNPFDLSPQAVDNAIFSGGQPVGLADPRVVAKPTLLNAIWADVKQPRRAIPASVRLHWNGDPGQVAGLLRQWHDVACDVARFDLPLVALLKGEGEGLETEGRPAVFREYVALVELAQSINRDGILNPITVIESEGRFIIESGERRWLAYHLLREYLGGAWEKIPAIKSDGKGYIWRQAAENTARRQLNAIGMARQVALLVMAARGEENYRTYEEMVPVGGCDRRYYSQVADGNLHRIPKGMGERIQAAMGLGMEQLSQYRALLRLTEDEQINDVIWTRGDVEDWPEKSLREIRSTLTGVKVRALILGETAWELDDLRPTSPPAPLPANPSPTPPPAPLPATQGGGTVSPGRFSHLPEVTVHRPFGTLTPAPHPLPPSPLRREGELPAAGRVPTQGAIRLGTAVEIIHTGEVGPVTRITEAGVLVDINGEVGGYHLDEVRDLGMTYDQFLREEIADMGGLPAGEVFEAGYEEETTPPDPLPANDEGKNHTPNPLPANDEGENLTPNPSPPMERGIETGWNKGHSGGLKAERVFMPTGDLHTQILYNMRGVLALVKLAGATRMLDTISGLTVDHARAMREELTLTGMLNHWHDLFAEGLERVMEEFDEALARIERAADDE